MKYYNIFICLMALVFVIFFFRFLSSIEKKSKVKAVSLVEWGGKDCGIIKINNNN